MITSSDQDTAPLSKTKRKQAVQALQELGARLADLSEKRLAELPLDGGLRSAILQYKELRGHEARRRQMQYIGRIMREVEVTPIEQSLVVWRNQARQQVAKQHLAEYWRDCLLDDEHTLGEFLASYPTADTQRLRTLIRNTLNETRQNKPPKNYRALFRELHALVTKKSIDDEFIQPGR
ncbi:MAG: ribosome biogenesis factor YjgA [Burkholderiales bacterium]